MAQTGLRPEVFIERIQDVAHIADEWPYSHMPNDTFYAAGAPTVITPYSRSGNYSSILVVDRAATLRRDESQGVTILKQRTESYPGQASRIEMAVDPSEVDAWNLLQGVRLAVRIDIGPAVHHGSGTRYGALSRILGVEQPLRTPGNHYPQYGQREEGYIHGEITRIEGSASETASGSHLVRVRLGKEALTSTLRRVDESEGQPIINGQLQEGQIFRTRVRRDASEPKLFYPANQDNAIRVITGL